LSTVRNLLRSPWIRAFLLWTALIAILVVPLWPAATTPFAPCVGPGEASPDPALPPCPPDDANYEGIGIFLLLVLWIAGVVILFVGFVIARVARRGS
jgi:hypothetical protein